ncbi:MAG TPA: MarR family transcriptional regulator [Solirubrobacteraceae bacterium]|jgi:DNA-binding MarR family transcriptional regulator
MSATVPRQRPLRSHSSPARESVSALSLSFKTAMAAVRRLRGRDTHRPGEVSYAQCSLLFALAERGELAASELASLADVAPATASQMLDSLEGGGFVERSRSDRDRRLVLVSLTNRGGELVAARRTRFEQLWADALASFSDSELATATAVLERARVVFEEIAAESDAV